MNPLKINLSLIAATVIIVFISSCESKLDITPVENNTSGQFYTNEIEMKQAVVGIYARLGRNGTNTDFATDYFWLASENRSDLLYIAGETSAQNDQLELRKYIISPNSGTVSAIFSRLYALIKDANNLLYNTKDGEYMRYRAEASFLRAYAYFELVRSFGPVALITKPIETEEAAGLPRESPENIYAQIIADLQYAAANLSKVYTGAESGRVGSLAANALLGEVYMTMAGYPMNDASAYGKAEAALAGIITDVNARFGPVYSQLFTLANENKYDLFSIQFASGNSTTGSSLPGYITSSSASGTPFPDWAFSSFNQQGQDMRVDTILIKEMKANNDLRFSASIDTGFWSTSVPTTRTWISKNIITKFLEKDNTNSRIKAWNDYPRNFPIIRDADVFLLYAEALVRNNKASLAKQYVDRIRTRAGLNALASDPTIDDIKRERKYEFIGEGRRYFDLVRWGETEAISILTNFARNYHSKTNGQLPTKKDLLLPIPQNELKTRNNWDQNFGY
ncbi:putative outer membrane starch-binding protein [Arcticibacter tournemirensis]|uniref:RagB/SusD family nutrient uptake outer membrane protein n=1 Tax=Arcticibacter tournemirensis TaxID=699437 RepID=A0A5M9HNT1_9SPHI|nr:RagB/SusD family nutrient uptake outer membrane protein [Arcticibacter tournemirensis]KAA8486667.1 RagB/SusD family nutrient uptake outer membrane protein [Arcticibacter tournemirensis]TQM49198.1 putative outer membrane starch-binding protein [Arcticibacter tournemirensis]